MDNISKTESPYLIKFVDLIQPVRIFLFIDKMSLLFFLITFVRTIHQKGQDGAKIVMEMTELGTLEDYMKKEKLNYQDIVQIINGLGLFGFCLVYVLRNRTSQRIGLLKHKQ